MTQGTGQVRAQEGGRGQWVQMHPGKQEDVSKATGMCLGGTGAGGGHASALRDAALREVEEDALEWVGHGLRTALNARSFCSLGLPSSSI